MATSKSNRFTITVAVLSFLMAFLQPQAAVTESTDVKVIKIGAVLGLTGAATVWGDSVRKGIELAAEEAQKENQALKIELFVEDSKTDAKQAVSSFKKLVSVDGVDVVIGDVWDWLTNPIIPVATQAKKLLLSPTVIDASVETQSPYFYTLGGSMASVKPAIDLFFSSNPSVKTAAMIYWNNPWGQAYLKEWKSSAAAHGVKITSEIGLFDWAAEYKTEIARILTANPDAVIAPYHISRIMKRLKEHKATPKVLTTSDILEVLLKGEMSFELADGVYFTDWAPTEDFEKRFTAKFGHAPEIEAHNGFDAFRAALKAIVASPKDPHLGVANLAFDGVAGPIDFRHGLSANLSRAKLRQIKGGKITTIQ